MKEGFQVRRNFATLRALRRVTAVVAGGVTIALVSASVALASGSGGNPITTGPNTITWTGQGADGGMLNTTDCSAEGDPFGANTPYLLWVLTTGGGGGSVQLDNTSANPTPVLHLGGSGNGDYNYVDPSNGNEVKFVSPYFTPDSQLTAQVNMNVTDVGNGTWGLKISHGCAGPSEAKLPTISKTAAGSYDTAYNWDIQKAADKTEIHTADGNATFNYTVTVNHDSGTNSNVVVNGEIDVSNPNSVPMTASSLTDVLSNGVGCQVSIPSGGLTLQPGINPFNYTCSLNAVPSSGLNNTATVTWNDQTLSNGSQLAANNAQFTFNSVPFSQGTVTNGTVTVTDPNAPSNPLGTALASASNPITFNYSYTFSGDPAGTCTSHDNTAIINETGQSSNTVTVKQCVGADLKVSKDATPSFDRTYNWKIAKAVDKTLVEQVGGTAMFNYTVTANQDQIPFTDSNYQVKGKITVSNPNSWEDISLTGLSDAIDNGGNCSLDSQLADPTTIPAGGSMDFPYTCSLPSSASGTNTATATWDAGAAFTTDGSASGSKDFVFGSDPTNRTNQTVTVKDPNAPSNPLGTLTATDSAPFASQDFKYSKSFPVPATGCVTVNNTATITETGQHADQSVKVCGPVKTGALTMGYWQNKNGQAQITGGSSTAGVCNSGTSLRQYAPFQDLSATATCAQVAAYVTNVIKAANASGSSMNAMLKAQMLSTALDVNFNPSIGAANIDLTKICKMIDGSGGTATCSATYENVSGAFGGATSMKVSDMLTYENGVSNVGGSTWYTQVKATQQLAKDAFDAINNQVAFGA
jgi:hypothetical protein